MMTLLVYCIIFSSFGKEPFPSSDEIVEDNRCFNDLQKCTKLADSHTHLRWCEQVIKRKFPQCAPVNLETSHLLEIGDFLGNCGWVAVASFPGVLALIPSEPLVIRYEVSAANVCSERLFMKWKETVEGPHLRAEIIIPVLRIPR
jgi:hypothetical protein